MGWWIARDAAGLVGVGLVSYGAWLIYEPAGLIVLGSIAIAFAWISGRNDAA